MRRGTSGASTWWLLAAVALASLMCISPAGAWSGNLLANSGFEDGNQCWDAYTYPSAYVVAENPYAGSQAMRVGLETGGRAQLVAKARPGSTYKVSCWAMVSEPGEAGYIGIDCRDMSGTKHVDGVTVTSTSYAYYEKDITLPLTLDSYVAVYMWKNDGPGYLYADEVCLYGPDLQHSPGNTTYYVDSALGHDTYAGTAPSAAWQSLDKVNSVVFAPGDEILFKCGGAWSGVLDPWGSGAEGNSIAIGSYGAGPAPLINGDAVRLEAVRLYNQEYWDIRDLEVTNTAPERKANLAGVRVQISDFGTAHDIRLTNLYVHDVNGSNVKSEGGGCGIQWVNGGAVIPSRFDGLLIEGCHLERTDRNGIVGWSEHWTRGDWYPSLNVVVRNNVLEDIGGDGIVPIGCDGALVEHNLLIGGRTRAQDYAAGMWPWSCDNSVFQYNEACQMVGTLDGQGFDCDYNSYNTLMQYNYSHDNDGGFMLICSDGSYSFNDGSIVRYNISQNDEARIFHVGGNVTNTSIYNNTIYIGEGMTTDICLFGSWNGWSDSTYFFNNIFYNLGSGGYDFGSSTNNVFDYNVFYGNHPPGEPADAHKLTSDPMLSHPGTGAMGRGSCWGYRLHDGSPCIDSGMTIPDNGGQDFWGSAVPFGPVTDRGAHEYSGSFPQVLLEVHPNEQAPGVDGLLLGDPYWTPPGTDATGAYTWKTYNFAGNPYLWIQVCAQAQRASNTPSGTPDRLQMLVDGVNLSDYWADNMAAPPSYQWNGNFSLDLGRRKTLRFLSMGVPGVHTITFKAMQYPIIWWLKVTDLEPGVIEAIE